MSYEDKLIFGITVPIAILFFTVIILIFYLYERKYHPKIKTNYDEIETPEPEFFEAKALRKRVHIYYVSELNIPKSVTEYFITFLLVIFLARLITVFFSSFTLISPFLTSLIKACISFLFSK